MRRLIVILAVIAVVVTMFALVLAREDSNGGDDVTADTGLAAQEVSSGDIDIVVTPDRLDDVGATFIITLDTHATELDADLTRASLDVDGTRWPVDGWNGDESGGHHRSGQLRFTAAGRPAGAVVLTMSDFPDPVEVTWTLEDTEAEP
jgi:hypothetical protein